MPHLQGFFDAASVMVDGVNVQVDEDFVGDSLEFVNEFGWSACFVVDVVG